MGDSSSGEFPPELEGEWDMELMELGITSGVGVHFRGGSNPGNAFMADVDARFDDGDLTAGLFRRLQDNTRFYYVMAE